MNARWQRFRLLVHVFHNRFFENDAVAPGSGFHTNIYGILGMLVAAGWFLSYFLMPQFLKLSAAKPTPQLAWTVFGLRMLFTSASFAIVGFATVFHWDMLFPDRRDFVVLGTLPVRLTEILAARVIALLGFVLLLTAALNVFPILMSVVLGGGRMILAQIAATSAASVFALCIVIAVQGVLIAILSPRWFARISPWVQMLGMSAMVLSFLLYPAYSLLLPSAMQNGSTWPWLLPPVWFAGVYDLVLGRESPLGDYAMRVLGWSAVLAATTWALAYRRHYARTLETETPTPSSAAWSWPQWLFRSEEERAIAEFSVRTLARSGRHRLFLVTYVSVGLSLAILFSVAVRSGKLVISEEGLRALPFTITFFALSGFRAVFQFPAELAANWILRMTEARWSEAARTAVRRLVLLVGMVPLLLVVTVPLELITGSWTTAILHTGFQFLAGALLTELLFWSFNKVPFTCTYFSGNMNLSLLAGLHLYGFTTYSFHLAELQNAMDGNARLAATTLVVGTIALAGLWRRRPAAQSVTFDSEEPLIRSLDLT